MPPLADTLSSSRADERYYSRNGCGRKPVARETSPGPSSAETASSWWLEQAATELEWMKQCHGPHGLQRFPPACYHLVKSLPGNDSCVDCGSRDTEWASPSYGALLCLQCSARHRSLGVEISKVRSLTLDHWSHEQVLSMLEGGNHQLFNFFQRHFLTGCKSRQSSRSSAEPLQTYRYRTKAARFYRENLGLHAARVASSSVYRGREASRKSASSSSRAVAVNQANTNNSSNS